MKKMLILTTLLVFLATFNFAQTSHQNSMDAQFSAAFKKMDANFKQMDKAFAAAFKNMGKDFKNMDKDFAVAFKDMEKDFEWAFNNSNTENQCKMSLNTEGVVLTEAERSWLVGQLTQSQKKFEASVANLTEAQLSFKSDTLKWSIVEVIEHVTLAENGIFSIVQSTLQKPTQPEKRAEIKVTDAQIPLILTNRKGKVQAPEILKPTGKFPNSKYAIGNFQQQRAKAIDFVKTTQDDLRNRFWQHPATGVVDLYQTITLMSAHLERHTLQIEEVKAQASFPK
jgi:DinB superfamily